MYAIVRDVLYVCQSANSDNHGKVTIYWYPDGYIQYLIVMQHPANSIANVSTTNRLFDELGKMLHTRKLSIVVADAATQGLFGAHPAKPQNGPALGRSRQRDGPVVPRCRCRDGPQRAGIEPGAAGDCIDAKFGQTVGPAQLRCFGGPLVVPGSQR